MYGVIVLCTILLLCVINAHAGSFHGKDIDLNKMTKRTPKPENKLSSSLSQLLDIYKREGMSKAADFTKSWRYPVKDRKITLLIEAERINAKSMSFFSNRVKARLIAMQARVIGTYKSYIEARINLDNLKEVSEMNEVKFIRLPFFRKHLITSEGVNVTGASRWHLPEVNYIKPGKPIKVAILDLGFMGYASILGIELPAEVTTRSFREDGDISVNDEHGTAVAEIIHDMAPDAQLYLVNFNTFTEFSNAVNWLITEQVDVISFSIGWFNAGAGDGTGPVNEVVDAAANAGIIWVNAAGNEAVSHWRGTFNDPDGDGWLNYSGEDETNDLQLNAGDSAYVYMNWNDWYAADQDFDLYVLDNAGRKVATSTDQQTGSEWPVEAVEFVAPATGLYHIAVYRYSGNKSILVEMFISKNYPQYYTPASSLVIPADNERAIAAGATYWSDDELEFYSSHGPTKDGRIKPDFTAPDGVSTVSYGNGSFFGTSAATPHVSGAFALLKEKISPFTTSEIRQIIERRSIDYGAAGKDTLFGSGRLYLLPQ